MNEIRLDDRREWLETDGLGGFGSGTVSGIRTRRYHGLLVKALTPPLGRFVMVNGFDVWLRTAAGRFPISTQRYGPDIVHPDGASRMVSFSADPWPVWRYRVNDEMELDHEFLVRHGEGVCASSWRLRTAVPDATLVVRPLLSCRDFHSLHHANPVFQFDAQATLGRVTWQPYAALPCVFAMHNGEYTHEPDWYRNFLYTEERARGLDHTEDLASPGYITFDISAGEAIVLLGVVPPETEPEIDVPAGEWLRFARAAEKRRRKRFRSREERSADAYIVRRGENLTMLAGYPWSAESGRDTLIALRGLCMAVGRWAEARDILLHWAGLLNDGLLPNRISEDGAADYASADAPLWFVIAAHELITSLADDRRKLRARDRDALRRSMLHVVDAFARGTRFGIHTDSDGLLAAGEPGTPVTWMDARVDGREVTPRAGKPVELQALWINALTIASQLDAQWSKLLERGRASFPDRFWDQASGVLHDVVDAHHSPGQIDRAFRPNQIFAVGGLPFPLLEGERARSVVEAVEGRLLTPFGLRSLAPNEPGFTATYDGDMAARNSARYMGVAWPWLLGPFVEAWVRVRGSTAVARDQARARFLEPLIAHLHEAGLGHISELADAEPPFTPRGAPFHSCSLGELLRLKHHVLA